MLNYFNIKNKKFPIYLDISITLICLLVLAYSLIPNSFNIVPIKIIKPLLGINRLQDIIASLHYVLIGLSITFIIQSFIFLSEYNAKKIEISSIIKIFFYKWLILTINSAVPYAFNVTTPPVFIILSIIILFLFWYISLNNN